MEGSVTCRSLSPESVCNSSSSRGSVYSSTRLPGRHSEFNTGFFALLVTIYLTYYGMISKICGLYILIEIIWIVPGKLLTYFIYLSCVT